MPFFVALFPCAKNLPTTFVPFFLLFDGQKLFLNRAYASTMALFCFSNFLAKSTVRPHPNFYGRRVLRSLPPTFMPFFVALFPCAQICSSSTWERWPPSRFLVYFACSVLCRPPSCHFLLHYFLAQNLPPTFVPFFLLFDGQNRLPALVWISSLWHSEHWQKSHCVNTGCGYRLRSLPPTFMPFFVALFPCAQICSSSTWEGWPPSRFLVYFACSVLCRPPSCHFLLHYFLAQKSAAHLRAVLAGHHHVFWFTLPAPFFAAHLHAIFLLHYFLAQKNCRTPAVYPRLFEFHHFDIQSTGQKSHCVNTGCGYRLRSLPPTFMPFFVALFPCAQICSSSTWEGWPPSRFLVYFACSVLCRPPSCHFLLHSKQTTGHH